MTPLDNIIAEQEGAWQQSMINENKPAPIKYLLSLNNYQDAWKAHALAVKLGYAGFKGAYLIGLRTDEQFEAVRKSGIEFKIVEENQ